MITLDPASAVPPYEQIRAQVAAQAVDGTLPVGTRLPPVRRLADELGIAANTVARAYRELEAAGVVETAGRNGTVVAAGGDQMRQRLADAATVYATTARGLGATADDAVAVLRAVFANLDPANG